MKRCLYILPTNFEHEGIKTKVQGQLIALNKRFRTRLVYLRYKRHSFFVTKLIATIFFELSSIWFSFFSSLIYVRYNPKSMIINIWLWVLSFFKPVYIEHNTIMDTELAFLNRKIEHFCHRITLALFCFCHCNHIAVNQELKRHLQAKGLTRVTYAQNGYNKPKINLDTISQSLQNKLAVFKANHSSIAIFTGNGYPWHGYQDIIDMMQEHPQIGIIFVGPYASTNLPQHLHFNFLPANQLCYLIEQCDFAISTFRWDMLSITEGSPLKSRQYLCHGCPILVNYLDCATDFKDLSPYIIDYRQHNKNSINRITSLSVNSQVLSQVACQALSWDHYFSVL